MKSQIYTSPTATNLINDDQQNFYGVCFNDSPNLYDEMINLSNPIKRRKSSSRTSISNTEILFRNSLLHSEDKELELKTEKKSCYQKLLISHDSIIKGIFDYLVLILLNISSLIILYDFCFKENEKSPQNFYTETWFFYAVEILFAFFIILQFFQTYQDRATLLIKTDFKSIALRYIKRWFFIDFLSVIPFNLFASADGSSSIKYLRMIRLARLPQFIQTIDVRRFDNLAAKFLTSGESENASKRLMIIFNIRYFFKIVRLLIMESILAYVIGCLWYLICLSVFEDRFQMGYPEENVFFIVYKVYKMEPFKKLILSCYYVLTGLTTVGYGDINAQNHNEKMFGITVMFLGVTIFSYLLSEFGDQINVYNRIFGERDQDSDLNYHISLLGQFCPKKPFNPKLIKNIKKHFTFFWKHNRMLLINKDDKYLSTLPKDLKISLVEYFWNDIFTKFNSFLLYRKYKNIYYKFYYELSFLLMPRIFSKDEIVYNEGDEVEELYFLMEGVISFYLGKYKNEINFKINFLSGEHLGVYNCLYNVPAEYECITVEDSKLYGINKIDFLKLLKDYPEIEDHMRQIQYAYYKNFKNKMDSCLRIEIDEYNNKISSDKKIVFEQKDMIEFNGNKNGMTINNFLEDEIKKRNDEIKKMEEILKKKYEESQKRLIDFKNKYSGLMRDYKEKYHLNLENNDYL